MFKFIQSIVFFLVLISFQKIKAQNDFHLIVKYNYRVQLDELPRFERYSYLQATSSTSVYEVDALNKYNNDYLDDVSNKSENNFVIKARSNDFYYKDLKNEIMIYPEMISMKFFNIKENLNIFDWELVEGEKEILGYKCYKAELNFRGRKYTAYYSPEVPISNGPWKFNGLPGLILEIFDEKKEFVINALEIKLLKNKSVSLANPYDSEKTISREEFIEIYKRKYEEVKRNGMSEYGPTILLPKKNIETYID